MTITIPTESQIDAGEKSCYRSGWPTPDEFIRDMERYDHEEFGEYRERLQAFAGKHKAIMRKITAEYLSTGDLNLVLRLGKLAKKDLTKALYILNYSEEP